jgi:hypothetical protein
MVQGQSPIREKHVTARQSHRLTSGGKAVSRKESCKENKNLAVCYTDSEDLRALYFVLCSLGCLDSFTRKNQTQKFKVLLDLIISENLLDRFCELCVNLELFRYHHQSALLCRADLCNAILIPRL